MGLPPGVHPGDPSMAGGAALLEHGRPVPLDQPTRVPGGRKPFGVGNADALPVFQRGASAWVTGMVIPSTTTAINANNPARVVGRRPGRTRLWLWVPSSVIINGTLTTTPSGVMFGSDEGELVQQSGSGGGSPINVGDPGIAIFSEGSVYCSVIPGSTVGYVCYLDEWNPEGGGLDF